MESIYLDHNATAPIHPEVVEAMARCHAAGYANPASQHQPGQQARKVLEDTRERTAAILGADLTCPQPDRLIFTASATEANNLAVLGIARAGSPRPGQVVISSIEHQSVIEPAEHLLEVGWRLDTLPVTGDGVVRTEALAGLLAGNTRLVSVLLGSHDTGVLQPVAELAALCNRAGVPLHTDAAQVVGKRPVDFRALGVAAMSIGAHKFRGPLGIGALLLRHDVRIAPLMFGGHQQSGVRPGTESVVLAVGMLTALEVWHREQQTYAARLTALRDRFEAGLRRGIPGIVVHGAAAPRLPHTSSIAFPKVDGQVFLVALSMSGIACSVGSACSSGSTELSPTLKAMNVPTEMVGRSLRFSLGGTTTEAEIDEAMRRIVGVWGELTGA
jgi:cysteine desulfurase